MLRNRTIMWAILMNAAVVLVSGCFKDKTVIFDTGAEITRPVSFTKDIIPIFNKSCNTSGCHSTGAKTPDLTADKAHNSLMTGNYVNTGDPQNSELYKWVTGKKATPMPPSGINKEYNALILAWIKQGAQNN